MVGDVVFTGGVVGEVVLDEVAGVSALSSSFFSGI